MENVKFSGVMENAYGKQLPTPVKFEGEYTAYENIDEVRKANDFPSDDEVVGFVNAKRKANKRQSAMQAALDAAGIEKPTLETDEDLQVKTIMRALLARKNADGSPVHTEESAEKTARATLGLPEKQ